MPKFNPPECFQFDKPADWSEWKQRFLRFRTATKLDRETPAVQVSSLVYAMGREPKKIYNSFQLPTIVPAHVLAPAAGANAADVAAVPDADNFDCMMKRFDAYLIPKRNVNYQARGGYRRNLDEVSEEYVATDTDDTYFLGSIFCESPVNSCNDKSRDFDSGQFCSVDCYVSDETKWDMDKLVS